jgi:hypothetical protein
LTNKKRTDANEAIDFIYKNSRPFAQAKANRIYCEEFRKSKKAMLMAQSTESAANAREQYAYSHGEYLSLLDALKQAVEIEEELRWKMVAAQARIEVWRSEEASARLMDRSTQ